MGLHLAGPLSLRRRIAPFLPRLERRDSPAPLTAVCVELVNGAPDIPGELLLRHLSSELRRDRLGALAVVAPGVSVTTSGACAQLGLADAESPHALRAALELLWPLLLSRLGLYRVHCAALRDREGRGWILVGDSGVGKSTSALALVKSGWSYTTDDAAFLCEEERGALLAYGWPEPVRVTARSARSLGIEYVPVTSTKGVAGPGSGLHAARVDRIAVHRLLFPELGPATAVRPLDRGEAVARLIRASPWVACDPRLAPVYLACLARAALQPAARLVLGPELLDEPTRLAEHLRASSLW